MEIGNLSLIVSELSFLQSTQNLQDPSFFFTSKSGDENGLWLGQMINSCVIFYTSISISFFWRECLQGRILIDVSFVINDVTWSNSGSNPRASLNTSLYWSSKDSRSSLWFTMTSISKSIFMTRKKVPPSMLFFAFPISWLQSPWCQWIISHWCHSLLSITSE